MPLYEWYCNECELLYEEFFKLSDKPKFIECEDCHGRATQILTKAPAFHGDSGEYARRRFPYYDENLDTTFNSLSEKNKYLKKKNSKSYEHLQKH